MWGTQYAQLLEVYDGGEVEVVEIYLREAVEELENTWLGPIKEKLSAGYVKLCERYGAPPGRLFHTIDMTVMDGVSSEISLTDEEADEANLSGLEGKDLEHAREVL